MEKKYSILIVDDDLSTVEIISMILQNSGYEIIADPEADMRFLVTGSNPDLIIMDYQIGDKSGSTLCLALKQNPRTKNIPVILISGIDDLQGLAEHACADDFLTKPFSIKILLQKVENLVAKKVVAC